MYVGIQKAALNHKINDLLNKLHVFPGFLSSEQLKPIEMGQFPGDIRLEDNFRLRPDTRTRDAKLSKKCEDCTCHYPNVMAL